MSIIRKSIYRIFVLRVSGKGDHHGSRNQLEVLRGHENVAGVAWLLEHFDSRIMKASSPAGRRLRAQWRQDHGLRELHRKGRDDFLGVTLVVDGTRFVMYASTAAQLDEDSGNAFTRHLCDFIREPQFTGHADPDFTARRDAALLAGDTSEEHPSLCNAFDATRFVRSTALAMELWTAAEWARAAFDVKDVRVDPALDGTQQMVWTFLAYGSEIEATVGKIRRFVGKLNAARQGRFPYRTSAVPLGWTTSGDGADRVLVPAPDQQDAVAALHRLATAGTEWDKLAERLGTDHGVTSTDPKTAGTPLHELLQPVAAVKRLYLRRKLVAYRDGQLELRFVGVMPNRLRPGSGHVLQRRWYGLDTNGKHDEYGAISYRIPAPAPTVLDHEGRPRPGWLPGISAEAEREAWDALIESHAWDDDDYPVTTEGQQDDDPARGTNPLRSNAVARSGAAGHGDTPIMALARLCLFRHPDGRRTKLFSRSSSSGSSGCGRYELRTERTATDREGVTHGNTELWASWPDHELRSHLADLILQISTRLLDAGHDLGPLQPSQTRTTTDRGRPAGTDPRPQVAELHAKATKLRSRADHYEDEIADEREKAERDQDRIDSLREKSRKARADARAADAEVAAMEDAEANETTLPLTDFGQIRDVIAALRGPFAHGLAPASFNRALRQILPGGLCFAAGPDSLTLELTATLELPLAAGGTVTATDTLTVPHAAGRGPTQLGNQRRDDLAERYMRKNEALEDLARDARVADPVHLLRLIRETLTAGGPRTSGHILDRAAQDERMPDPLRRAGAFASPIPEVRALVWHRLTGTPGRPPTAGPAYSRLINDVYFAPAPPDRAGRRDNRGLSGWAWHSAVDHRLDQHTILAALPAPAAGMRADHLGMMLALPGSPRAGARAVLDASTDLTRNGNLYPATTRRLPPPGHVDGWYGKAVGGLPPENKLVGLPLCPHPDCPETYATAVVFAPEVLCFGTSMLCRRCRRPAVDTADARATRFPASVIDWADSIPRRTGSWTQCHNRHCTLDVGAGAGVTWRWDDDPSTSVRHDDTCRLAA